MKKNIILILYLLISSVFAGCTNLFFQPDSYLYTTPDHFKLEYKNIFIESLDKTRLHGWFISRNKKFKKAKGLAVLFHGNAQNLSSHFLNIAWMTKHGYDVLAWDYRGYGVSKGETDPKGAIEDGISVLNYAINEKLKNKYPKLFILGQSLGGNILMRSLVDIDQNQIDLICLDSTFNSHQDIAFEKLKGFWATFLFSPLAYLLVSDKYSADEHIQKITTPTIVIHGTEDKIIPIKFGKEVFSRLKTKDKSFFEHQGGVHISAFVVEDNKFRNLLLKKLNE